MTTATALHILPTAEPVEVKETALAVIPEAKVEAIFLKGEGIDELLAACEEKAMAVTTDVSTAKGRAEIKSMAYLVARTKTAFDVPGKALSAEYKEKPKTIDGHRKKVADYFEDLQKRVRDPLTKWEESEKTRIATIEGRIRGIEGMTLNESGIMMDVDMCEDGIATLNNIIIDESFAEFSGKAQAAKDATLAKLYALRDAAARREAEAAELARLRREQEQREQADREAKIAKEAAENAIREAEEKSRLEKAESEARELRAKLAQEQAEKAAEQAKRDAEDKVKQAVEDERRRKAEEEAVEQFKEAARQADEDNRWRVHSEILEDLESSGFNEKQARDLLAALMNGEIRNVVITY